MTGRDQSQEAALDLAIQRHASAYVARGSAISDSIIAECIASRQALKDMFPPAAKTPVSGPQSGEGELMRKALAFYADPKNWITAEWSDETATEHAIPGTVQEGAFACDCGDRARAALTPAPRDQATYLASATVCDRPVMEEGVDGARLSAYEDAAKICEQIEINAERRAGGHSPQSPAQNAAYYKAEAASNCKRAIRERAASLIVNQKNLRGSEPEPARAGDASSRCDKGSKMR